MVTPLLLQFQSEPIPRNPETHGRHGRFRPSAIDGQGQTQQDGGMSGPISQWLGDIVEQFQGELLAMTANQQRQHPLLLTREPVNVRVFNDISSRQVF